MQMIRRTVALAAALSMLGGAAALAQGAGADGLGSSTKPVGADSNARDVRGPGPGVEAHPSMGEPMTSGMTSGTATSGARGAAPMTGTGAR